MYPLVPTTASTSQSSTTSQVKMLLPRPVGPNAKLSLTQKVIRFMLGCVLPLVSYGTLTLCQNCVKTEFLRRWFGKSAEMGKYK